MQPAKSPSRIRLSIAQDVVEEAAEIAELLGVSVSGLLTAAVRRGVRSYRETFQDDLDRRKRKHLTGYDQQALPLPELQADRRRQWGRAQVEKDTGAAAEPGSTSSAAD